MIHRELELGTLRELAQKARDRKRFDSYLDILNRMREKRVEAFSQAFEEANWGRCVRITQPAPGSSQVFYLHPSLRKESRVQLSEFKEDGSAVRHALIDRPEELLEFILGDTVIIDTAPSPSNPRLDTTPAPTKDSFDLDSALNASPAFIEPARTIMSHKERGL